MIDPLQHYPAALKEIIETFEQDGLDRACAKALKLLPCQNPYFQKPLESNLDSLGFWLWSVYFDSHWMSETLAEWMRIHQNLLYFLENDPAWFVFHEPLLEKLRAIQLQTQQIHQWLLEDNPAPLKNLSPVLYKRFCLALSWLTKDKKTAFRLPVHQLVDLHVSDNPTLGFWEACLPTQKPAPIGSLYLASDLLSACYGEAFLKEGESVLPIEASLENPDDYFLLLDRAFENNGSHPLAHKWKVACNECQQDPYQTLLLFGKKIQNQSRKARFAHYGPISRMSLIYRYELSDWYEKLSLRDVSHEKNILKREMTALYQEDLKKRLPRVPAEKKLTRILHVTSQLIDQGHAPSRILHRLLAMGNRERLDQAVLVSETLIERNGDYPSHLRYSGATEKRAPSFLRFLEKEKIAYLIERPNALAHNLESLETLADRLAARLNPLDADAIVFHGPEALHHALSARLEGPLKVLFEHGTLPKAPGFDVTICCLEDTLSKTAELEALGTRLRILPFAADSRWGWKSEMPKKEDFGLPETCRIATTISNHLKTRLQPQFCKAVSEILKRITDLYYVPIGRVENESELLERFDPAVRSRIRFLGSQQDPSQYTRCMDIYFNEFPFGSCYGILDAMASGCPVVSMYDPKGPPQARYGAIFMGIEEGIQSGNIGAYIEKACLWLQNPLEYFKASQKSFQNYEWRSNYWAYIEQFELILLEEIDRHQRSISRSQP